MCHLWIRCHAKSKYKFWFYSKFKFFVLGQQLTEESWRQRNFKWNNIMVIDINNFIFILPYHEVNASSAIFVSTNLKWDLAESSSLDCPQIWFEEKFEAFHFSLIGFLREHKSLGQNFQNIFCQHLLVSESSHFRFVCWEWNWLWFLWLWLWFEQSWTHVEAIVLPIQTDCSL